MLFYVLFRKLVLILYIIHAAKCYNMDIANVQFLKKEKDSLFGYSLAIYDEDSGFNISLLVGAPGTNSNTGAAYICNINTAQCHEMKLFTNSSKSWRGATVLSQDGTILVCAPNLGRQTAGTCQFRTKEMRLQKKRFETLPLVKGWQEKHFNMCANGLSATLLTSSAEGESEHITILTAGARCADDGILGVWVFDIHTAQSARLSSKRFIAEIPGYAIASGNRKACSTDFSSFIAVSIGGHGPSSYAGLVYILDTHNLTAINDSQIDKVLIDTLGGKQAGEYFGASLSVQDLNGDGRDDLIVGAPIHSDYGSQIKYEIGAVYIFYQSIKGMFSQLEINHTTLLGSETSGRFGFSAAGIDDTNGDRINDLAVGAPYESDGHGTVYIYHGSKKGIKPSPAQIIRGQDFTPPLQTLGWSFAALDYDQNFYSDIVIGAPQSNTVLFVPARPLISVQASATFHPTKLYSSEENCIPNTDTLEKQLPLSGMFNFMKPTCATVKYCFSFSLSRNHTASLLVPYHFSLSFEVGVIGSSLGDISPVSFLNSYKPTLKKNISTIPMIRQCWDEELIITKHLNLTFNISAKLSALATSENFESAQDVQHKILPLVDTDNSYMNSSTLEVILSAVPLQIVANLPWWVYVASGLGALTITSVIIVMLTKMGFFKRKTIPNQREAGSTQKDTLYDGTEPRI